MSLFELDEGRLVPAEFGHEAEGGFSDEVLETVRRQVLEIVSRPLFPITWRDVTRPLDPEDSPRLTALDASGQVVAVEVVRSLSADRLIDSLSRLADAASMSWTDLARQYPGGLESFRAGWTAFRQAMPTAPPNGPRLILVASKISPEVRPALDVLASSGIEVHEMSLRETSNGRVFLDVDAVGPRLYGHRLAVLSEGAVVSPALVADAASPAEEAPALAPAQLAPTGTPTPAAPAPSAPAPAAPVSSSRRSRRATEPAAPSQLALDEPVLVEPLVPEPVVVEPAGGRGAGAHAASYPPPPEPPAAAVQQDVLGRRSQPASFDHQQQPAVADHPPHLRRRSRSRAQKATVSHAATPVGSHAAPATTATSPGFTPQDEAQQKTQQTGQQQSVQRSSQAGPRWRPFPSRQEVHTAEPAPPPRLAHDAQGLSALAFVLGQDAPLALRPQRRTPAGAYLSSQGVLITPQGQFTDPTAALVAAGFPGQDGWTSWYLGDAEGPSLAEAIAELNED